MLRNVCPVYWIYKVELNPMWKHYPAFKENLEKFHRSRNTELYGQVWGWVEVVWSGRALKALLPTCHFVTVFSNFSETSNILNKKRLASKLQTCLYVIGDVGNNMWKQRVSEQEASATPISWATRSVSYTHPEALPACRQSRGDPFHSMPTL